MAQLKKSPREKRKLGCAWSRLLLRKHHDWCPLAATRLQTRSVCFTDAYLRILKLCKDLRQYGHEFRLSVEDHALVVQCPLQFWPIFNETEPHFLVDLCRRWNAKTISGFGSVLDWTQTEVGSYLLDASVAESRTPFMSAGKMDAPPLKGRGGLGAKFELTLGEVVTRHQSQPLSAPIAFLYFIFRQTLHFSSNLWRDVDLFAASDPSSLFLFQFVTARDFSVVLWVRVPNTLEATLLIVTLAEYRITPAFLTLNLNALRNALSLTVLFTCHSLPTPATKSLIPPLLSNTWKNQSDRSTSQNRMRLLC
ncbi:hypothetical protein GEV33_014035 [Tenebrio molitor]|uniref:Uncharacterized protein n=1 Tax=Tenebrio molitor TaxID=7067 RepID=A0A8J6H6R3_TENMO|nr:hypothetical protein GEV33_014035 [Tenebrio molitor]